VNRAPGALDRWEGRPVEEWARRWDVPLLEAYDELPSTNDRLCVLAEAGAAHFTVVTADSQTAGKGRSGKRWESPAGMGLWISFLVRSESQVPATLVPILVGLAATRALERLCPSLRPGIKWPNDIYCQGRKLAGILIESPAIGEMLVLGIGINLNNSTRQAPGEIARKAIAVADITGTTVSPESVLTGVLREIELLLASLRTNSLSIADQWRARCMLEGRTVGVRHGDLLVQGVCQGIDDLGHLVVMDQGEATTLASGSIEWIEAIEPGE